MNGPYLVFGDSLSGLSDSIAALLDVEIHKMARCGHFLDGEWDIQLGKSVRNQHVFIVQSTCPPVNDNLMQLLIMIQAAKLAEAASVSAVVPYFGYARQDRKERPRRPITAALVCRLIKKAGANRALSLDLHAGQIQGFFDGPFDNMSMAGSLLRHFHGRCDWQNVTLMSPDAGGITRCQLAADKLECAVGFIDKRRLQPNASKAIKAVGEVRGRTVIFLDDMADTLGTLAGAAQLVAAEGAKHIFAACTHGVLSGPATQRLADSPIEELVITDTIPLPKEKNNDKIRVVSASKMIASMIRSVFQGGSLADIVAHSFDWAHPNPK